MNKKVISIRYWCLGRGYHTALSALEYASKHHTGLRKDGSTPELDHQLSIAHYVKTLLSHLQYPEETLATAFLHDVCEDYDVGFEEIEVRFGKRIRTAVELLTKKHRGERIDTPQYYKELAKDPIASIDKGADRIHNTQTMSGVFDAAKQHAYIQETEEYILPMLKAARRRFTQQEPAYENIKHVLNTQIALIKINTNREWLLNLT
jgi:(p)ppGpp synthase/HD superfamily hydrolase